MGKSTRLIGCGAVSLCCGLIILLAGVISGVLIHQAIDKGVEDGTVLSPADMRENNDEWKGFMSGGKDVDAQKSSLLLYYVFNVTNPAAVIAGSKPNLQEVGPYCTYTNQTRFDVAFSSDETSLSSIATSNLVAVPAAECKAHMTRVGGHQAEPRDASLDTVTVINGHFIGAIQQATGPTALAASVGNTVWSTIKSSLTGSFINSIRGSAIPKTYRSLFDGQRKLQFPVLLGKISAAIGGGATFVGGLAASTSRNCTAPYNFPGGSTCPLGINTATAPGSCDISATFATKFATAAEPGSIFNSNSAQGYGLWLQSASYLSKTAATRTATETAAFNGLVNIVKDWTPCNGGGTTAGEAQQAIGRTVSWMSGTWWPSTVSWTHATGLWRQATTNTSLSCDGTQYCGLEVLPFIQAVNPAVTELSANVAAAILPENLGKSQTFSVLNETLATTGYKLWQGAGAHCARNTAYDSCEYISSTTRRATASDAYDALHGGLMRADGITSPTAAERAKFASIVCGTASWLNYWGQGTAFFNGELAKEFNTVFAAHNISLNATDMSDLAYLQFATGAVTQTLLGAPSLANVSNSGVTAPVEFSAITAATLATIPALPAGLTPNVLTVPEGRALLDALAGSTDNVRLILNQTFINADGSYNAAKAATFNVGTPSWVHPLERAAATGAPVKLGSVLGGATQTMVQQAALQGQGFVCSYASLRAGNCDYTKGGFFITDRADRIMFEKYSDPFVFNVVKSRAAASGLNIDCAGGPKFQDTCPVYGRGGPLPDYNCAQYGFQAAAGGQTAQFTRTSTDAVRKQFYSGSFSVLGNSVTNPMFAVYPGRYWADATWQKQYTCSSTGPGKRWNQCLTTVATGKDSLDNIAKVESYLGNTTIDIFSPNPIPITGTDGTQFKPEGIKGFAGDYSPPNSHLIWVTQAARALQVDKTKETKLDDVKLFRYEITEAAFANAQIKGTGGIDVNTPKGLADGTPLLSAPAFLGPPHFVFNRAWGGSEWKYLDGLDSGNLEAYETFVDIEPVTGKAFRGAQRLQVAFKVDRSVLAPSLGTQTASGSDPAATSLYIPLFWGQQSGVARETDTSDFKNVESANTAANLLFLLGLIFGILFLLGGCICVGCGIKAGRGDPASNVGTETGKYAN